jgi:hypothetical protein
MEKIEPSKPGIKQRSSQVIVWDFMAFLAERPLTRWAAGVQTCFGFKVYSGGTTQF